MKNSRFYFYVFDGDTDEVINKFLTLKVAQEFVNGLTKYAYIIKSDDGGESGEQMGSNMYKLRN